MKTGVGSAMQIDPSSMPRFAKGGRVGAKEKLGTSDIPEIRRLLRTTMTIPSIAANFDVTALTLRNFIKRRAICDLKARREFITLQRYIEAIKGDDQP